MWGNRRPSAWLSEQKQPELGSPRRPRRVPIVGQIARSKFDQLYSCSAHPMYAQSVAACVRTLRGCLSAHRKKLRTPEHRSRDYLTPHLGTEKCSENSEILAHDSAHARPKTHRIDALRSAGGHTTFLCKRSRYPATFRRDITIILREGATSQVCDETCTRVET